MKWLFNLDFRFGCAGRSNFNLAKWFSNMAVQLILTDFPSEVFYPRINHTDLSASYTRAKAFVLFLPFACIPFERSRFEFVHAQTKFHFVAYLLFGTQICLWTMYEWHRNIRGWMDKAFREINSRAYVKILRGIDFYDC